MSNHAQILPIIGGLYDSGIDPCLQYTLPQMVGATSSPVDNKRNVLVLRALQGEERAYALRFILMRRRQHLIWLTKVQAEWRTKVSRRPQRNRNHDSWDIREKYAWVEGYSGHWGHDRWVEAYGEPFPRRRSS